MLVLVALYILWVILYVWHHVVTVSCSPPGLFTPHHLLWIPTASARSHLLHHASNLIPGCFIINFTAQLLDLPRGRFR